MGMKKNLRSSWKHSAEPSKADNFTKASSKIQHRKKIVKRKSDVEYHRPREPQRQRTYSEEQGKTEAQTCETAADIPQNLNVGDYMDDIDNHLRELDSAFHRGIESGLRAAGNIQITSEMRKILVKWLSKVSTRFGIQSESLHICVQIIDYMLIHRGQLFNKANFQLLGIASFFISCKYNEIYTLDAQKYVQLCNGIYSLARLFEMESIILLELKFNLQVPTLYQFINKLILHLKINSQHATLIKTIVDISILDFNAFNNYRKHDLAIAILCFASKLHKIESLKQQLFALQLRICPEILKKCLVCVVSLFKKNQSEQIPVSI